MRRPAPSNDPLAPSLRAALEPTSSGASNAHLDEASIAAYLSRELGAAETEELERHFAQCARCTQELVAVAAVEDEVRQQSERVVADGMRAASATGSTRASGAAPASGPASSRRAAGVAHHRTAAARPRRSRTWLRIAAGFTIVLGALVVAAGAASNVVLSRLEPSMLAGIGDTLGRAVAGGGTSLVLAGGPGVKIDDLTIAEDPRFGSESFARVRRAALQLDPGALLRGQVRGAIHLDEPVVHLLRDTGGVWNVETLNGKGLARAALVEGVGVPGASPQAGVSAGTKKARAVRLTSASVADGVLAISDRGRGRDVTLRDVDLTYRSPAPDAPAAITLQSTVGGEANRVAVRGEIGPFEGGGEPRWRFDEVRLQRIALADIPGAPRDLTGELTFDGTIASSGSGIETVVMNATGDGDLGLANGELRERNLTVELLDALTQHASGDAATTVADVLERARRSPALAAVLAASSTSFEDITGEVAIAHGAVTFEELAVDTPLFQASAAGSVSRAGALEMHGTLALTPAATAAIVAILPETQRMFDASGKLAVPFSVAGAWPDVSVKVDVRTAVAQLAAPIDPRKLSLLALLAG